MSDLLEDFYTLFTFLVNSMSDIANFFTSNLIGQLILGVAVFSIVFNVVLSVLNNIHR